MPEGVISKARERQAKKDWKKGRKKAIDNPGFGAELEDGRYKAQLTGAEQATSEASGRLQLNVEFTVMSGKDKGASARTYPGLDNEDQIAQTSTFFFERLGYEMPEEYDDLDDVLQDMLSEKPAALIQLKTRGDFQNVKIQKLLSEEEMEEEEDEDEEEEDEEEEVEEEKPPTPKKKKKKVVRRRKVTKSDA